MRSRKVHYKTRTKNTKDSLQSVLLCSREAFLFLGSIWFFLFLVQWSASGLQSVFCSWAQLAVWVNLVSAAFLLFRHLVLWVELLVVLGVLAFSWVLLAFSAPTQSFPWPSFSWARLLWRFRSKKQCYRSTHTNQQKPKTSSLQTVYQEYSLKYPLLAKQPLASHKRFNP